MATGRAADGSRWRPEGRHGSSSARADCSKQASVINQRVTARPSSFVARSLAAPEAERTTQPERDLRELSGVSLRGCQVVGHHLDTVAGLSRVTTEQFGEAAARRLPCMRVVPAKTRRGGDLQ